MTPDDWRAVALSLRVSVWAVLISLPLGIYVAHLLSRPRLWGQQVLNILVHLPLILPPVVTGYLPRLNPELVNSGLLSKTDGVVQFTQPITTMTVLNRDPADALALMMQRPFN